MYHRGNTVHKLYKCWPAAIAIARQHCWQPADVHVSRCELSRSSIFLCCFNTCQVDASRIRVTLAHPVLPASHTCADMKPCISNLQGTVLDWMVSTINSCKPTSCVVCQCQSCKPTQRLCCMLSQHKALSCRNLCWDSRSGCRPALLHMQSGCAVSRYTACTPQGFCVGHARLARSPAVGNSG